MQSDLRPSEITTTARSPRRREPAPMRSSAGSTQRPVDATLIDLQRLAGNAAVSAWLSGKGRAPLQRDIGWSDAPASDPKHGTQGINKEASSSGAFTRYPVHGISFGNAARSRDKAAWEDADHRAIVLMPSGIEPTSKPDVLVLLHGHSIGWREGKLGKHGDNKLKKKRDADPIDSEYSNGYAVKGDTRDRFPDNVAASLNPNMIAVMPQGTTSSDFGSLEPKTYVHDALKLIDAKWEKAGLGRIVMSAHSGGGPGVTSPLAAGARGKAATPGFRDIALFDAINGPGEEKNVRAWLTAQIGEDIANLEKDPDDNTAQQNYLATSVRFQAFFSDTDKSKKHPRGFYVDQHVRLQNFLAETFKSKPEKVTAAAWTELTNHYVITGPEVGKPHDDMIRDNLRPALDALGLQMPLPLPPPPSP